VTGVEVVIGNCLPVYLAPLKNRASKLMGSRIWPFGVTWRHRSRWSRWSTLYWWSIVTMRLYIAPLWGYGRLKFFQESSSRNS